MCDLFLKISYFEVSCLFLPTNTLATSKSHGHFTMKQTVSHNCLGANFVWSNLSPGYFTSGSKLLHGRLPFISTAPSFLQKHVGIICYILRESGSCDNYDVSYKLATLVYSANYLLSLPITDKHQLDWRIYIYAYAQWDLFYFIYLFFFLWNFMQRAKDAQNSRMLIGYAPS